VALGRKVSQYASYAATPMIKQEGKNRKERKKEGKREAFAVCLKAKEKKPHFD